VKLAADLGSRSAGENILGLNIQKRRRREWVIQLSEPSRTGRRAEKMGANQHFMRVRKDVHAKSEEEGVFKKGEVTRIPNEPAAWITAGMDDIIQYVPSKKRDQKP